MVMTSADELIGAFSPFPFRSPAPADPKEAFLYTFSPLFHCTAFPDCTPPFCYTQSNGFGFGDPTKGFGLWVDQSLRTGYARMPRGPHAPPKVPTMTPFEIYALEVWAISLCDEAPAPRPPDAEAGYIVVAPSPAPQKPVPKAPAMPGAASVRSLSCASRCRPLPCPWREGGRDSSSSNRQHFGRPHPDCREPQSKKKKQSATLREAPPG